MLRQKRPDDAARRSARAEHKDARGVKPKPNISEHAQKIPHQPRAVRIVAKEALALELQRVDGPRARGTLGVAPGEVKRVDLEGKGHVQPAPPGITKGRNARGKIGQRGLDALVDQLLAGGVREHAVD